MKRLLGVLMLLIFACLGTTQAQADPCGGQSPFNDVAQNDIFCSDATWAKNAQIVFGCNATDLCPHNPVTRAQVLLFLRRMAEATFPGQVFTESSAPPSGDLDTTGVNTCTTGSIAVLTANIRFAHVHAVVSLRAVASADVQVSVGHSVDGGAFSPNHTVNQIVTVPPGQWVNASVIVSLVPISPLTSNAWRIDMSRAPGSATTGQLTDLRCQVKVITHMAPIPPF